MAYKSIKFQRLCKIGSNGESFDEGAILARFFVLYVAPSMASNASESEPFSCRYKSVPCFFPLTEQSAGSALSPTPMDDGLRKPGLGEETTAARFSDFALRFVSLILTFSAAVVIAVDKQTKTVPIQLAAALPPLHVPVTARWHYLSAIVYFVVANAIACSYAALSLALSAINKGKSRSFVRSAMIVMDIVTVALLFSGFGAAAAVGVLGGEGNSHLRWNKICNVFGRFCGQAAASLFLSLLGATSFLFLAVLSAFSLRRGSI